jgi:L-ascorbate metabolism protein UlaG (beta-lactamase superfamily)
MSHEEASMDTRRPALLDHLHWLGHDSFRIDGPLVIYIDPWNVPKDGPKADLILVSHGHHDHCSPEDVEFLRTEATRLVTDGSAAAKLKGPVTILKPGDSIDVGPVKVEAVPAYNTDKTFHPRQEGHVGFVVSVKGERLYFAGDTDVIPEMKGLGVDVALLPVSGVYTMTAEQAAQAAADIRPRVAVPMHYGAGVAGELADAERFRSLSTVPVVILSEETGG